MADAKKDDAKDAKKGEAKKPKPAKKGAGDAELRKWASRAKTLTLALDRIANGTESMAREIARKALDAIE